MRAAAAYAKANPSTTAIAVPRMLIDSVSSTAGHRLRRKGKLTSGGNIDAANEPIFFAASSENSSEMGNRKNAPAAAQQAIQTAAEPARTGRELRRSPLLCWRPRRIHREAWSAAATSKKSAIT